MVRKYSSSDVIIDILKVIGIIVLTLIVLGALTKI